MLNTMVIFIFFSNKVYGLAHPHFAKSWVKMVHGLPLLSYYPLFSILTIKLRKNYTLYIWFYKTDISTIATCRNVDQLEFGLWSLD